MNRWSPRVVALGALVVTVGVISACSSSGTPSATSGSGAATSGSATAGKAAGSEGATGSNRPSGSGTRAAGQNRSVGAGDPRRKMPAISPPTVAAISYGSPSGADRTRFAAVTRASGGLLGSSSVKTLLVAGDDVGGVASYAVKPGLSASPTFQDQYVVQLVNAVAGHGAPPRFVRADGHVMALSTGPAAVAGWFEGTHVVLLYRQAPSPDLAALALSVRNTPTGR